MSTLSSVATPTPTTATRTVAITREESRLDVLETARRLMGSTSLTASVPWSITAPVPGEQYSGEDHNVNQTGVGERTRVTSSSTMSREVHSTAPVGMATPMAQDLIWPGHPDIQGTNLFPSGDDPSTLATGGLDLEERWKTVRTPPKRDPRHNTFGQGGFMSPMQRVAEATCRIPEVQDTDVREGPLDHLEENERTQRSEERDVDLEHRQMTRGMLQVSMELQVREREDNIQEPDIMTEQVPLLNGGPPARREVLRSTPITRITMAITTSTTQTPPMESLSLSSTPPVSSTGMGELP